MKNQNEAQAPANSQKANLKQKLNNIIETLKTMVNEKRLESLLSEIEEEREFLRVAGIECAKQSIKGDWELTTNYFTCGSNVFGREAFAVFRKSFFDTLKIELAQKEITRAMLDHSKKEWWKNDVNRFPKGRW